MLTGIVAASVTRPPRLVTNPWLAASAAWFSMSSWIASLDVAVLLLELLLGGGRRGRQRTDAVDGAPARSGARSCC